MGGAVVETINKSTKKKGYKTITCIGKHNFRPAFYIKGNKE